MAAKCGSKTYYYSNERLVNNTKHFLANDYQSANFNYYASVSVVATVYMRIFTSYFFKISKVVHTFIW